MCTELSDFGSQTVLIGGKGASDFSSESLVDFVRRGILGLAPRVSESLHQMYILEFSLLANA